MGTTNSISLKEAQELYSPVPLKKKRIRKKVEKAEEKISKRRLCVACMSNSCEHTSATKTVTLTPLDISVLRLVATGMYNKEIAATLGKTEGTIKTYIGILSIKTRVSGRVNMALWYIKHKELLEETESGVSK